MLNYRYHYFNMLNLFYFYRGTQYNIVKAPLLFYTVLDLKISPSFLANTLPAGKEVFTNLALLSLALSS